MNWQELYKKIAFLDQKIEEGSDTALDQEKDSDDKSVDEDTVEECGPMGTPDSQPDNVSMNVSLNGSGAGGIKDLMAVLRSIENGDDDHDMPIQTIKLGDQAENEAFANEPNAEYQDINYMTKDIAGGLNDQHRQYKKEYPGDNPMAVKKLETKLGQMYEEFKTRT
jgi:hypothetical protein